MSERVTLATSTGLPFLALAFHFGTGLVAIVAGFLGLAVRKGGQWHRRSGLAFVYSMIATGITAFGIAIYEGRLSNTGGVLIVYLVFTAYTAVRPVAGAGRGVDIGFMVFALGFSAAMFARGYTALGRPGRQIEGVPAGMMLFLATVTLLAAVGDARMIRAGGLQGARRLARHLWRMCFSLFIATGSFFLGQMKFVPERIRSLPLLFVLALSPLALLLYWMWRVRLRQNLRGMMTAKPIEPRRVPEGKRATA
ncbi:MAG TPA: hypothetical protein VM076_25165 [Gemmatimonadaceae bacterium]|nr:hypothetical protein [Gemmatimonadaceae bacterium]